MTFDEFKKELLSDSEVKKEYEALEPEYQIVRGIIQARMEKDMTQQELADITGIDRADISKLENGSANPSLRTLKRLADGLGKKLEIRFM